MLTQLDPCLSVLHGQHTLKSDDFLTVYHLAKAETQAETIEAYSFEEFLGLAVHLFVSTQSQPTREQLSQLLPKFGSAVILPLLKIVCNQRLKDMQNLQALAWQSLEKMEVYALIIGLNQVLDGERDQELRTVSGHLLKQAIQASDQIDLLLLSKLLSKESCLLLAERSPEELSQFVDKGDWAGTPLDIPVNNAAMAEVINSDGSLSGTESLTGKTFQYV